ncbi:sulfurtransferase [Bacillus testis]|uniref:sulfurtransferase n=1 Tax=Bacillus testis TaxID=1622072 RepID=UPI00067F52E5|nr:sulfurtransferase [Bacillus testis]
MIKTAEWLTNHLSDSRIRIIDCRFKLNDPLYGRKAFEKSHIPGAVFFDLEKDISGEVREHGGRHPLPDVDEFAAKLEKAGISNDLILVAYDDGECSYASRFVWMMHYLGHKESYVLNGGFSQWIENQLPVEQSAYKPEPTNFQVNIQETLLASYEEVKELSEKGSKEKVLVDSRDRRRYEGLEEPIDKKAGHIPGAVNYPWTDGLEDRQFLDGDRMKARFKELDPNKKIIVYCGSGVTASPNYLALKQAGFPNVKVYIGSYSDWVSYENNPVATN